MSKIVIVQGHPHSASLCASLAQAYAEAASQKGHEVRRISLPELSFNPILQTGFSGTQPLEPDLIAAQQSLCWAQHLVIVYPIWWAAPPALLKGFFDRTFLPGFAFKYRTNSPLWDKLLKGRSARLIVTSDSPKWYLALVTGNPAVKSVKQGTLEFSGIAPVRVTIFPMVRKSTPEMRAEWLKKVQQLGSLGA